jgi:hypothetical protein
MTSDESMVEREKALVEREKEVTARAVAMDQRERLESKDVELMRTTIRHENDLINHRITWLIIFNGFAMNAFNPSVGTATASWYWRSLSVATVSIVICISAGFSLALAGVAIRRQMDAYEGLPLRSGTLDQPGFGILGARLKLGSTLLPRLLLPAAAVGIWVFRLLEAATTIGPGWSSVAAVGAVAVAVSGWQVWESHLAKQKPWVSPRA